jgi:hypothetical protein
MLSEEATKFIDVLDRKKEEGGVSGGDVNTAGKETQVM